MEELICRNPRRNSTQVAQDLPQDWDVTHAAYKDLPLRGIETVKSPPHNGASRPANPLVTLEDRIEEIFYHDVRALLSPPSAATAPLRLLTRTD